MVVWWNDGDVEDGEWVGDFVVVVIVGVCGVVGMCEF